MAVRGSRLRRSVQRDHLDPFQTLVQRVHEDRAGTVVGTEVQQPRVWRNPAFHAHRDTVSVARPRLQPNRAHGKRRGGDGHCRAEAGRRSADVRVKPGARRHLLGIRATHELHHGHGGHGFGERRREHPEQCLRQLRGVLFKHQPQAGGEKSGALDDPLHVRVLRLARADVEAPGDFRELLGELAAVLPQRFQLGDVGVEQAVVDHGGGWTGAVRLSNGPPARPRRRRARRRGAVRAPAA